MAAIDSDSDGSQENGVNRSEETQRTRRRGAAQNLAEIDQGDDEEVGEDEELDEDMCVPPDREFYLCTTNMS